MEPSYLIVLGLVLGAVIGIIKGLGDVSPYVLFAAVIGVWVYGGTMYEPDEEKSWLAQQVGQFAVGWDGMFQQIFAFVDEVAS